MLSTLAQFKHAAVVGARFVHEVTGEPARTRTLVVAHAQSNAIAFCPYSLEQIRTVGTATAELDAIAHVAQNPNARGFWLHWPKASRCDVRSGTLYVRDQEGREYLALTPTHYEETL